MTARTRLLTLALLAAATTGALTACGTPVDGVAHGLAAPAAATSTAATSSDGATATDGATGQAGAPAAAGQGTGSRTGSGSGAGSGPAPAPAPAPAKGTGGSGGSTTSGPAIASFRVVAKPNCATPGKGVTIAWSVTGADGAAIAVDNPTVYGAYGTSYPAKGQDVFPFTCDATGTTTHTFTVWPAGAKGTSKTLSVSASVDG